MIFVVAMVLYTVYFDARILTYMSYMSSKPCLGILAFGADVANFATLM